MTAVMIQTTFAAGDPARFGLVFVALALVLGLTLLAMLFAERVMRVLGVTGVNVIGRVLGIVLAALACQLVIDGISESGLLRLA